MKKIPKFISPSLKALFKLDPPIISYNLLKRRQSSVAKSSAINA